MLLTSCKVFCICLYIRRLCSTWLRLLALSKEILSVERYNVFCRSSRSPARIFRLQDIEFYRL